MNLQSIQAIVFDARFPGLQNRNLSREEALLSYLQPFFRESLERLSALSYTFFWLDESLSLAEGFLRGQYVFHFFKQIYPVPLEKDSLEGPLGPFIKDTGYRPEHVLYVSFELHPFYIFAKQIGCSCFLFHAEEKSFSLRTSLPKLYALVPWLLKSKGLAPLYWSGPRRNVLQACLGLQGFSPFVRPKNTKSLAELVDKVFQQLPPSNPRLEEAIVNSWEGIVGAKLASQCRPGRIIKGRQLMILAYNTIVKQELHFQARSILKKLQGLPGGEQFLEISIQQRV